MRIIHLSKEQIQKLVSENAYKIDPETKFLSRCIDERYQEDISLPSLAIPGADAGELALLFATAHAYGFEIRGEKAYQVLTDIVGGVANLHFHTDTKNQEDPIAGCTYFKELAKEPTVFNIKQTDVDFIRAKVKNSIMLGAKETVLTGEHLRGAIIQIKGQYGIYPTFQLESFEGNERVEFFMFHETLVKERHRILARELVKQQGVKLYEGCDDEYLYEVLSDITDRHFFETVKRAGNDLPLYQVTFRDDGTFNVEEMGRI